MRYSDILRLAALNLKRRKVRTLLTVCGVVIGTLCILLMMAVGLSNYTQIQKTIDQRTGLTQISIYAYPVGDSDRGGLTDAMLAKFSAMEHVEAVSPVVSLSGILQTGEYKGTVQLYAVTPEVLRLQYEEGGPFAGGENMPALVIGDKAARQMETEEEPLADMPYVLRETYEPDIDWLEDDFTLTLGYDFEEAPKTAAYPSKVVGYTSEGDTYNAYRTYIDLDTLRKLLMQNQTFCKQSGITLSGYTEAVLCVEKMELVPEVQKELEKLGYTTSSQYEEVAYLKEEQIRQQSQLLILGAVSLLVSSIGIANTMYAGILERQGEIGILKIAGMRRREVRRLFLTEAVMIGGLGGILGALLSYGAAMIINVSSGGSFLGVDMGTGMRLDIPLWLTVAAIGIAAAVGAAAGIYPAHRAASMPPMEALRREH